MSDVIFSGSKSRKPMNSASVTLIFNNSDKIDYNKIIIEEVFIFLSRLKQDFGFDKNEGQRIYFYNVP